MTVSPAADATALEQTAPHPPLAIRYLGFSDVDGRRRYALRVQRGVETRAYGVSIDLQAFASRQALLQDGPDICYQKLRSCAAEGLPTAGELTVTEADLAAYRAVNSRAPRRTFSSPPPETSEGTPADSAAASA